jgi:nucleotide-binding universal stress UspA family protein
MILEGLGGGNALPAPCPATGQFRRHPRRIGGMAMLSKVLLATDGSPSALAAARWVGDLAAQLPGLRVTVLHVVPVAHPAVLADGGAVVSLPSEEDLRREAQALLEATAGQLGGAPAATDLRVERGGAPETIAAVAEAEGADLIVVGHRGLNPLAYLVLGSVAERVVRLARRPVVVIRG